MIPVSIFNLGRYHHLSNVEPTFRMIERQFGEAVMSKTDPAMANEVLCKILYYPGTKVTHR